MPPRPPLSVSRAMFHHCQDTGTNCGRTCAQMIISSFTQSPGPGDTFAAPTSATAIVKQDHLRLREKQSSDMVATPQWFTHPVEMRALLATAPEFTKPFQKKWRLASHASESDLMADVLLALERGMPSVIGVYSTDHWVVVTGAMFDAAGDLEVIRMLNPLPTDSRQHTYIDACSDRANGESYGPWELFEYELAGYSLEVGTVPPPSGMKDVSGRYVGIIQGTAPKARQLRALSGQLKKKRQPRPRFQGDPILDPLRLKAELERRAATWGIDHLKTLLDVNPQAIVRVVKDIDGGLQQYTLMSLFSRDRQYGVIAAFEPGGTVLHLQFTKDEAIDASLRREPNDVLWWTRRWLPSLPSPYFPFARTAAAEQIAYSRLIDRFGLKTVSPQV